MCVWGLIGASTIAAQYMIRAIRAQDGHEVLSVLSGSAVRGAQWAAQHDIGESTTSLQELLARRDIQCVYISTTNEKHHGQCLAALDAGKHVLCEKPLALSLSDAHEMVACAKRKGLVLATNHHLRNAGSHLAMRDLLDAHAIGDVLSVRIFHAVSLPESLRGWRINNVAAGGGVILDIVVHDADTVRFHLGEDPRSVVAIEQTGQIGDGVEDGVMSVWEMPSGVTVQTHESFTHGFAPTGLEFHGTCGSITARHVMTQQPVGEIVLSRSDGTRVIPFKNHDLYTRSLGLFAEAIQGRGEPSATGRDGVKSLAVALAVKEAAVSGRRVTVDYGEEK